MAAWKKADPLEHMQLPPPTSWATDFSAVQRAIEAKFASDPSSLGKRQATVPLDAAACMMNANATTGNASSASATVPGTAMLSASASSVPFPSNATGVPSI